VYLKKILSELGKDSIFYGLSSVSGQLVGFILLPFYTQALSPEIYAMVALLAVLIAFISPISGLSLDGAFFRYYSFCKNTNKNSYLATCLSLKILGNIITAIILFIIFDKLNEILFQNRLIDHAYYYLIISVSIESISTLLFAYLRVKRRVHIVLIINIISLLVGLSLSIYLVIYLNLGLIGVLIANLSAISTKLLCLVICLRNTIHFKLSRILSIQLLKYSLPKIPHKISAFFITSSTILFVNYKLGLTAAGIYFVANKISKPLNLIMSVFHQAWVPYRLQIHKIKNKNKIFKFITEVYFLVIITCWLILSMSAPYIFNIFINERYHEGVKYVPFILLIPLTNIFYFMYITGYELHQNQNYLMYCSLICSSLQAILTILLLNFFPPYNFIFLTILSLVLLAILVKKKAREIVEFNISFQPIVLYSLICIITVILSYTVIDQHYIRLLMITLNIIILFVIIRKYTVIKNYE